MTFDLVGAVSGVTRHYTALPDMMQDIRMARVAGGMHFRTSAVEGEALGRNVGRWVLDHHFRAR